MPQSTLSKPSNHNRERRHPRGKTNKKRTKSQTVKARLVICPRHWIRFPDKDSECFNPEDPRKILHTMLKHPLILPEVTKRAADRFCEIYTTGKKGAEIQINATFFVRKNRERGKEDDFYIITHIVNGKRRKTRRKTF